jgi:hypothetical protein
MTHMLSSDSLAPGTLMTIIAEYKASPEFTRLALIN